MKAAARRGVSFEQRSQNIDPQDQQSESHQALGDAIHAARQGKLKHDDGAAQHGHHGGMSQGVEQSKAHAAPAVGLHAGDVGDGGDVVVVESVMKPEDRRRKKRELKALAWSVITAGRFPDSSLFHKLAGIGKLHGRRQSWHPKMS